MLLRSIENIATLFFFTKRKRKLCSKPPFVSYISVLNFGQTIRPVAVMAAVVGAVAISYCSDICINGYNSMPAKQQSVQSEVIATAAAIATARV